MSNEKRDRLEPTAQNDPQTRSVTEGTKEERLAALREILKGIPPAKG